MQLSDRVTGLALAGLGAIAAWHASKLPPIPGQQIGPSVFPIVIGVGLCACGGLIALGVGHHFEEEAEADLAAHSDAAAAPVKEASWWRGLMALIPLALLVLYVLAVETLGFS